MNRLLPRVLIAVLLLLRASAADAQVTLTQGTNFGLDVAADGRLAMDLLGGIWILPPRGGEAMPITPAESGAQRPRWSPTADSIVYQQRIDGQERLWLYRFEDRAATQISDGRNFDHHPAWHPDGDRIVFSSDRRDTGFDLWETDIPTGLSWRLSDLPGDETEPAWSADGRDLVYVHRDQDTWSLVLRRHGQAEEILVTGEERIAGPSWRPDGSLVVFWREADEGLAQMVPTLAIPNRPLQDIFEPSVDQLDSGPRPIDRISTHVVAEYPGAST